MARRKLSVRDAAQVLGVRLDSLYALIWAGKIPAEKRDGRWRIAAAAIEKRKKERDSHRVGPRRRRAPRKNA
jgi:excisionase family DNA binding protein